MKRDIKSSQRGCRVLNFVIDGTQSTPTISGPDKNLFALKSDVGTGSWTVTIKKPGIDAAHTCVQATSQTDAKLATASITDVNTIAIKAWTTSTNAAVDAVVNVSVVVYDCADYFLP